MASIQSNSTKTCSSVHFAISVVRASTESCATTPATDLCGDGVRIAIRSRRCHRRMRRRGISDHSCIYPTPLPPAAAYLTTPAYIQLHCLPPPDPTPSPPNSMPVNRYAGLSAVHNHTRHRFPYQPPHTADLAGRARILRQNCRSC